MLPFRHGVASFDPLADAVLLWTRVDPEITRVGWKVAQAPTRPHAGAADLVADVVAEGSVDVDPEAGRGGVGARAVGV